MSTAARDRPRPTGSPRSDVGPQDVGPQDVDPAGQDRADAPVDALLLLGFGGPEARHDVVPFLEQVTRGRGIPRERLEVVGSHYFLFGGRSPINDQNRALLAALRGHPRLSARGLPWYWGNRNWHPFLVDTLREMAGDGVRHAAVLVTSAFSSASGCRQYREDMAGAQEALRSEGVAPPALTRLDRYFDAPGFVDSFAAGTRDALGRLPEGVRDGARLVFTAHSVPTAMAERSGAPGTPPPGAYVAQLRETARLVASSVRPGRSTDWDLVFQSRSGPPTSPWLEPDVVDHLEALHAAGTPAVVLVPVGFVSDHMEVLYDLDTQAAERAAELGLPLERAATPGDAPAFCDDVADLVADLLDGRPRPRLAGPEVPWRRWCPVGCCAAAQRPGDRN